MIRHSRSSLALQGSTIADLDGSHFVELCRAASGGDAAAVEALAANFHSRLVAYARRRGASDPEGLANLALATVFDRLDRLDFVAPEQCWAYLCRTVDSRIIDDYRRRRFDEVACGVGAIEVVDQRSSFEDQAVERDEVRTLLDALTTEQRQVLELRFFADLSLEETSTRMGRTQGAVKGLQRRALRALLAAMAVVLVMLAVRFLASGGVVNVEPDLSPVDQPDQPDGSERSQAGLPETPGGLERPAGQERPGGQGEPDAPGVQGEPGVAGVQGEPGVAGVQGELGVAGVQGELGVAGVQGALGVAGGQQGELGVQVVSRGTGATPVLQPAGEPVPVANHGVRTFCAVSHLGHGAPLGTGPGRAATLFFGNTTATPGPNPATPPVSPRGTCEGGATDRSTYWMPVMFSDGGEAVVPERILVEYKAFGSSGFDRTTIRSIPSGLHLVAHDGVANRRSTDTRIGGTDGLQLRVLFPSCLAVDSQGRPIVASDGEGGHLSYPVMTNGSAAECPSSHPHRIPTLSYTIWYRVDPASGWSLASGLAQPDSRQPTGGAFVSFDGATADQLARCVRDSYDCRFVDADGSVTTDLRSAPDGTEVYRSGLVLADDFDRTPWGDSFPPVVD